MEVSSKDAGVKTVRAIVLDAGPAEALDSLPERAAEAIERLQRLCLARWVA